MGLPRFQETEEGRHVPEDPSFSFGLSTQFFAGASPSKAGNHVLDFLEQEIPSLITKVNDKKFTIKAEAFHKNLACQIKVYIYQQESGCAVEFQRRSGDGIAFAGVYSKATEYLSKHLVSPGYPSSSATSSTMVLEPPRLHLVQQSSAPSFISEADDKDSSSTWIQTVREAPHLQDELAGSLLDIAVEGDLQDLAAWCEPDGVEVLLEFLASDRFVCAYPAARLLARLAALPEARSHLLRQGLLTSVLPRLWVQATGIAVWLLLANLVYSLSLECATHTACKDSKEAAASITAALQLEPLESNPTSSRTACVGQQLREALSLLS